MRRTRHFAGVIGAAGIVVSPFMMTSVAQADDTLPPDRNDYAAVGGDANPGDDVPNLPVTRVVGKAASLDLMVVDGNPVALDVPAEVKQDLSSDGVTLTTDELKEVVGDYVVDGDLDDALDNVNADSDVTFYDSDAVEGVGLTVEPAETVGAPEVVEPTEATGATDDSVPPTPVAGKAAALDIVEEEGVPVAAVDLSDEVKQSLPASGELPAVEFNKVLDVLEANLVDGDIAWDGTTLAVGEFQWTLASDVPEEEPDTTAPAQDVVNPPASSQDVVNPSVSAQDVINRLNNWIAQRNTTAPSAAEVEAPAAENETDVVADSTPADVPTLPVTGEDDAAPAPASESSGLPLAPLLGITGLVLGGGIGVITLRKKLELADSK